MKTILLTVISQRIREAMELYCAEQLEAKPRLEDLPVVVGPCSAGSLPKRAEIYDEIFSEAEE